MGRRPVRRADNLTIFICRYSQPPGGLYRDCLALPLPFCYNFSNYICKCSNVFSRLAAEMNRITDIVTMDCDYRSNRGKQ